MSAEQKAIAIADKIVPAYRNGGRRYSCTGNVAKMWQAAYDGAYAILTKSEPFQARVQPWLTACFGELIAGDREERNHRFLEEALELVQACGCSASEAHQLVDYVFGREAGDPPQEVGGVMVTLAALCLANGLDMHANAETELARIWTKVEAIRAKQAAKPKHSPLPQITLTPADLKAENEKLRAILADAIGALEQDYDLGKDSGDSDWEGLAYQRLVAARTAATGSNTGGGCHDG